jgi:hypothetical protein
MRAKTRAWVSATVILPLLGGKERSTPGVNTKNSKNAYTNMNGLNMFYGTRRENKKND